MSVLAGILPGLIYKAVRGAMTEAVKSPTVPVESSNPNRAAEVIAREVVQQVKADPQVQHVTNTESPLQSRVTLGAVGAIASGIGGALVLLSQGQADFTLYLPHIGSIGGGCFALVGRWIATRPLGA